MNTLLTKGILATTIALTVAACSSGGGDVAGIGGSGYVSSGSITGFGSVFVNGVEFETNSTIFDIEGTPGSQSDLGIGMIVKVNGTINTDGITGTASSISFNDELQGPVIAPITYDVDGVSATFTVLGTKVIIDSSSTTFDIDDNLSVNTIFDFDTIAVNNNVEVSGFFDTSGNLQATRVELKDITFGASSIIEVKGIISGLNGTTFNFGVLEVLTVDASAAAFEDLPNGLQNGQLVEVKGSYNIASNTVIASKVEAKDDSADDTEDFEIEGIITNYIDDSNFKINGIKVDASNLGLTAGTLMDDLFIEADGPIINGVLIATEIKFKGGDIKVHAMVSSSNQATNSFEVEPLAGQTITVTINSSTQIEGDGIENIQDALTKLFGTPGFVEIRGLDDGSGGITALEIDIKGTEIDDVKVQGLATAAVGPASNGTMIVLGVTFNFDFDTTDFEVDNVNMSTTQVDALITAINTAPKLVKIEDKEVSGGGNAIGTADAIEIDSL